MKQARTPGPTIWNIERVDVGKNADRDDESIGHLQSANRRHDQRCCRSRVRSSSHEAVVFVVVSVGGCRRCRFGGCDDGRALQQSVAARRSRRSRLSGGTTRVVDATHGRHARPRDAGRCHGGACATEQLRQRSWLVSQHRCLSALAV